MAETTFLIQKESPDTFDWDFTWALDSIVKGLNRFELRDPYAVCYHTLEDVTPMSLKEVPVGSVEYVHAVMKMQNLKVPKPINLPVCLHDPLYSGRDISNKRTKEIPTGRFYKCNAKVKGGHWFSDIAQPEQEGDFQISSKVQMDSEWRVFVDRNYPLNEGIVGVVPYAMDANSRSSLPSLDKIRRTVARYNMYCAPVAYTLDFYVNELGTFALEAHNFYSCGLYGWYDAQHYPAMLKRWWNDFVKYEGRCS